MRVPPSHEGMGKTIWSHYHQSSKTSTGRNLGMEKRRKASSSPEPHYQVRNNEGRARGTYHRASRKRRNHRPDSTQLLVARHESMDRGIRSRVRDVPTK